MVPRQQLPGQHVGNLPEEAFKMVSEGQARLVVGTKHETKEGEKKKKPFPAQYRRGKLAFVRCLRAEVRDERPDFLYIENTSSAREPMERPGTSGLGATVRNDIPRPSGKSHKRGDDRVSLTARYSTLLAFMGRALCLHKSY